MPFFLYEVTRANDDDTYVFEADLWAPTEADAHHHLFEECVWSHAEKVVHHLQTDHGAEAEASEDTPGVVLISHRHPQDPAELCRAETWTIGGAPKIYETPEELAQARTDLESLEVPPYPR